MRVRACTHIPYMATAAQQKGHVWLVHLEGRSCGCWSMRALLTSNALLTNRAPWWSLLIRQHRALLLRGGACDLAVRTLTATLCRCLTVSSK